MPVMSSMRWTGGLGATIPERRLCGVNARRLRVAGIALPS